MLKTLRTAPVTAELRYLGSIVVISLGLCAVAACLVSIAVAAHLGFVGFLLLLLAAGACTAIGGAWWLLRRTAAGRVVRARQTRPARYLPLVLDIGFFGWAAAVLAGHVEAQLRGAPVDANRWGVPESGAACIRYGATAADASRLCASDSRRTSPCDRAAAQPRIRTAGDHRCDARRDGRVGPPYRRLGCVPGCLRRRRSRISPSAPPRRLVSGRSGRALCVRGTRCDTMRRAEYAGSSRATVA